MRILYIHQFYAGPEAPGPRQPRDFVRKLAERGHAVEVVACDLNAYNEQTEPEEDRTVPDGGRIRVHRLHVPRGLRASLTNRLKTYGQFAWSAYRFGHHLEAPDIVMATIQPLFGGAAALQLARRWKRPFLLEIRDLWPDALVVKKAIAPWQAVPLQALARRLYFHADRIVTLTPGLKTELLKKGIPSGRLDLFPNSYDETVFEMPPGTRERIRAQYGWDKQFTAVYTGSLTEVTAAETIVRAGTFLKSRPDIRIDLFGYGQRLPMAMSLASELGLTNVHFHEPVPKSQVPAILAGADAALMSLFRSPLIHIYFENKFIDYMGARKPILAALEGVQADLIRRTGAGMVLPTFDAEALAQAIRQTADQPELCQRMGDAGHQFLVTHLRQADVLNRYADVLEATARGEAGSIPAWDPFT